MKIRKEYTCPLELTHDIIKGKWKPIILWQLGRSNASLTGLEKDIQGINQKMLMEQLKELVEFGMIGKNTFDGYPLKVEYFLTERGKKMLEAIGIMQSVGIELMRQNEMDTEKMIINLIDNVGVSFIGSLDDEGFPNMKAMLPPRKREGIKSIYFTTNTSSMRVGQFKENPKASLYFCDNVNFLGVMLRGTMEVLEDSASKEMIWRDGDTMYYSLGVTDPDYCVLKFTATNGRLYSNFSSEDFEIK